MYIKWFSIPHTPNFQSHSDLAHKDSGMALCKGCASAFCSELTSFSSFDLAECLVLTTVKDERKECNRLALRPKKAPFFCLVLSETVKPYCLCVFHYQNNAHK